MTSRLTDETRARIVELCKQGRTRNSIAREVGRATGSVSAVVKAAGLTFDRAGIAFEPARTPDTCPTCHRTDALLDALGRLLLDAILNKALTGQCPSRAQDAHADAEAR